MRWPRKWKFQKNCWMSFPWFASKDEMTDPLWCLLIDVRLHWNNWRNTLPSIVIIFFYYFVTILVYCIVHIQLWFYTFCLGSIIQTFDGWYVHSCPLVRTHCTCESQVVILKFCLLKNPLVNSILDEVIWSLSDQAKLAGTYATSNYINVRKSMWRTLMMDLTIH